MSRRAVTLIELLVVIGIFAVLVGLSLAGVQAARASAQRTACQNNLRQIGLGLHHYQFVLGSFPSATRESLTSQYALLSWMGRLLPFVGEDALWTQAQSAFQVDPFQTRNATHVGISTPVATYFCPASQAPATVTMDDGFIAALGSYRGVDGTNMLARDGLIFRDSAIRAADVRDGLSHTLAVGESQPFPNGWNTLGVWYNGIGLSDGQHLYGAPEVALGTREINLVAGKGGGLAACPAGPYGLRPGRADDICSVFQFWSGHRGGANFLMADGAVRFLTYDADPILPALGTRSGGEPAPVPGN